MHTFNSGSLRRILALVLALILAVSGAVFSYAAPTQSGPPTRYGDGYTPLGISGDLPDTDLDSFSLGASGSPTQMLARNWREPGATDWSDTLTLSAFNAEYWYSDYIESEQGESYSYRLQLHPSGSIGTLSYMVLYCYMEEHGDWQGILDWVDVSDAEAQGIDVRVYYTTDSNMRHWDWPWAWDEDLPPDPGEVRGIAIDLQFSKIENMHGELTPQYFDHTGTWGSLVSDGTYVDIHMLAPKEETGFAYTNAEFFSWFKRADEDWAMEYLENTGEVTVYVRERGPDPDPVLVQYEWVGDEQPTDVSRPSNDWVERHTAYYPRTQSISKTHTFNGWYHDADLQKPFARGTAITEDVTTLYGTWSWDDVTVEYRWVGSDVPTDTAPPAGTLLKKGEVYTAQSQTASAQDYTFDGWYANADLTIPFHSGAIMSDLVLYGAWSKDEVTVSYEWIGDDFPDDVLRPDADTVPVGSWYEAKEQAATGQYYLFSGWYENQELSIPFTGATIRDNTVLYGAWEKETVKVTYHWTGDDTPTDIQPPAPDTVRRGEAYESKEQAATAQPFTFNGWYRDAALTDKYADNTPIFEDTALFGEWVRGKTTVYYKWVSEDNPTDTTVPANAIIPKGTSYTAEVQAPTAEPFIFAGWFIDQDCSKPFVDGTVISDYTVLYGKWTREQIAVTYNWVGNEYPGDVTAPAAETVGKGLAYRSTKQADSAEPYSFTGWFIDQALTVRFEDMTVLTENTALYGSWAVHTVTVSYKWVGDVKPTDTTPPASERILRGETYQARPQTPSEQPLVFEGWYLDQALKIKYSPSALVLDTILYGSWSKKDTDTPSPTPDPGPNPGPNPDPDPTPDPKPSPPLVVPTKPGGGGSRPSGGSSVQDRDRPRETQQAMPELVEIEIVDETPPNVNCNPGTGR